MLLYWYAGCTLLQEGAGEIKVVLISTLSFSQCAPEGFRFVLRKIKEFKSDEGKRHVTFGDQVESRPQRKIEKSWNLSNCDN